MLTHERPRTIVVIPARYASTRFPAKMLAPLRGKPLVMHTYEQACRARLADKVVIATDDARILDALRPYGAQAIMTRADHASGTDRIAEAVSGETADIVVNVQGDEPLLDPDVIDAVIEALAGTPDAVMATARHRITETERITDPNVVKVVCDRQGAALYFSRCPIPFVRDTRDAEASCHWQHIGLYAYRRDFLMRLARLPQTALEKLEKLEQLRVLENGHKIMVVDTEYNGTGVDVPEDLETVDRILAQQREEKQ